MLDDSGRPLFPDELEKMLAIGDAETEPFERRLQAMARDAQLMVNRKGALCIADKLDLVAGRIQGHPDGFGFLIRDDGAPDAFVTAAEMSKVMHGDRVMAREAGLDRRGRVEAQIVEVVERARTRVVGRFTIEHGIALVQPSDRRIAHDILVPADARGDAQPGQIVDIEIVQQPARHAPPIGRVVEVLGEAGDPGMEIEIALRKHDLPHVFDAAVEAETAKLPKSVRKLDLKGRVDLRALPLVTIDGETARDFDDAVHCVPQGKGFKLYVAIADVSHYVRPGSALDRSAAERGNSVYFPRRVIPMLPEALSNGLCSLNPHVDRLCMVCEMDIGARGAIERHRFYPAVMHSQARLTYTEVWDALSQPDSDTARRLAPLLPHLQALERVFRTLLAARERRGAIDFESVETRMLFDEHSKIEAIVRVGRNDAHRLIEECMLAANVCTAQFLSQARQPALYRVHEGPTPERLERLHAFLAEFGLGLTGGDKPEARDYAKLLARVKNRPDADLLQTVMLRSMQQARYAPEETGHFGLAYDLYTHFTSPIRRYPDLVIHRAIKAVLAGRTLDGHDLAAIGTQASMTERRADEATRDVEAWLKCWYMRERVGESFDGTISGVTGFGVFVTLDTVFVEGLVHISELGGDYFHFDAARHHLLGERTGRRYRLADRLRVTLSRVDLDNARLEFVPADRPAAR
ncbi:MAG: ribonuclease R [Burkholderiales bacterium]|nr:ribonuclease R [Burkholderiales bacterium]